MASPFVINSTSKPLLLVYFMHGLGDNGAGWMQAFEEIRNPNVCYVFPNAPAMPVTLNFGMMMPSWFDIRALDFDGQEDKAGIQKAADKAREAVKELMEKHELSSEQVIMGGFSQGGATALYAALTHQDKLGGVLALSSWLPLHKLFVEEKEGHSLTKQKCQIMQYHGSNDPMVKPKYGKMTNDLLKNAGAAVELTLYPGLEHSSCPKELNDIKKFIESKLPSK